MAETSITGVKIKNFEAVLDLLDQYFSKFNLKLVEERIGDHESKFTTSPKHYANLNDYEKAEIDPLLNREGLSTTNFDLYSNLGTSPDWCLLAFPSWLAELTLNIDEDLSKFLSRELQTTVFDFFEYTVVNQIITRHFENGELKDKFYLPGSDEDIECKEGYFDKVDLSTTSFLESKEDILGGFWEQIGYKPTPLDPQSEQSRRPMYLKGNPKDILNFLKTRKAVFYLV
jgi:hypothetical protein